MNESARIDEAVSYIRQRAPNHATPRVGLVLGSGLGGVAERLKNAIKIPYEEIPGYHKSQVEGHAGCLCLGEMGGVALAIMQGRIHLYEGHPVADVVLPIRVLVRLGAQRLIITNAAGGINDDYRVGDLMLLSDHLNLTGTNPLVGANDDALGVRFPDMTHAYDPALRSAAVEVAKNHSLTLHEGVYAGLLGPSYETPAEIRMLRTLGADAVGMSTVLEILAAHHMGAKAIGISCICNAAAGLSDTELSHDEVKEAADGVEEEMSAFVRSLVVRYGE
jgi:purine-nucleoside phosphorylase